MIGPEKLQSISAQSKKSRAAFTCREQIKDALKLLQSQIGSGGKLKEYYVHWFWKLAMVPPPKAMPNAYILDSSLQCDNERCISLGKFIQPHTKRKNVKLLKKYGTGGDVFQRHFNVLESHSSQYCDFILGISLDSVRTLLAEWVLLQREHLAHECWCPVVPIQFITFVLSRFLLELPSSDPG